MSGILGTVLVFFVIVVGRLSVGRRGPRTCSPGGQGAGHAEADRARSSAALSVSPRALQVVASSEGRHTLMDYAVIADDRRPVLH